MAMRPTIIVAITSLILATTATAATAAPTLQQADTPRPLTGTVHALDVVPGHPDYTIWKTVATRAGADLSLTALRKAMWNNNFNGHDDVSIAIFKTGVAFAVEYIVAYKYFG